MQAYLSPGGQLLPSGEVVSRFTRQNFIVKNIFLNFCITKLRKIKSMSVAWKLMPLVFKLELVRTRIKGGKFTTSIFVIAFIFFTCLMMSRSSASMCAHSSCNFAPESLYLIFRFFCSLHEWSNRVHHFQKEDRGQQWTEKRGEGNQCWTYHLDF